MRTAPNKLQPLPQKQPTRLNNLNCPYCGKHFAEGEATKEHVIGRRFVPKGTLNGQWNLILNACEPGNALKADLEDDLSALTMHPDPHGWRGHEADALKADAQRKASRSFSRHTGKAVVDSTQEFSVSLLGSGISLKFSGLTPPQIDENRACHLALMQGQAAFFLMSYKQETRLGGFWLGKILFVNAARRADWGNVRARFFMDSIRDWNSHCHLITADEHFKLAFAKAPESEALALAVEWNEAYRLLFFIGADDVLEPLARALPAFKFHENKGFDGRTALRMRTEVPLPEDEDDLFEVRELDNEDAK